MFYYVKYKAFIIKKIFSLYMLFHRFKKNRLEDYLEFCSEKIAYYAGKGNSLEGYGYIDKKTVMSNFDRFVNPAVKIRNIGYTSGTTGTPGRFFRDFRSMAVEQYAQRRYFGWRGKYMVVLRGEKLFYVDYNSEIIYKTVPFIKEMYVSSYHLTDRTLANLVKKLSGMRRMCLWAYPSAAYLLAEYCLRNNVKLKFDIVALSSETIYDYQVEVIEKAFGRKIKDWYGQAERIAAFYRCEYGRYHEVEGYSHVEFLPVSGTFHEIAGTTLNNRAMPLVRYKTNDLIELAEEKCRCGHQGVSIKRIHGRKGSYLQLPNGTISETNLGYIFKSARNVLEAQVIQGKDLNVTVKVVRDAAFSEEDEKLLLKSVFSTLPADMCRVVYVDRIERDAGGKFRFLVNENNG